MMDHLDMVLTSVKMIVKKLWNKNSEIIYKLPSDSLEGLVGEMKHKVKLKYICEKAIHIWGGNASAVQTKQSETGIFQRMI